MERAERGKDFETFGNTNYSVDETDRMCSQASDKIVNELNLNLTFCIRWVYDL